LKKGSAMASQKSGNKTENGMKAPDKVQGEGDYEAARAYDKDQRDFIAKNKNEIPSMAKDAAKARDREAKDLDAAENIGKAKARH